MLSVGIAQQEVKGLARQNYASVAVGLVFQSHREMHWVGREPTLPVPAPQGAQKSASVSLDQRRLIRG